MVCLPNVKMPENCHECDAFGISDVVGLKCPCERNERLYSYDNRPEGCPQSGGWISVKDRLPEEDLGACIVYDGFKVQHANHYIIDGEHLWNTPDCYESEEIRGVTHWMPLPKPPKEEEQ